ncbi:MAG: hypothetical protein Unbinned4944contig1000_39 [Prokaryotic dsDNA virus sp.]|nr:MAG: hypothetical protein Unbinned4944contig1000_39 [Prokaryotic dsDNA virus sp.]
MPEVKRPTIPGPQHQLKMKPPNWEHDSLSWETQPLSVVRSFRLEMDGSTLDLTITAREFVSTQLSQSQGKRDSGGGGDFDMAFTVTVWGALNHDHWDSPSVGRSYRWREGDHIHGSTFVYKTGLTQSVTNAVLKVLRECGHSVSTCDVAEDQEVSHG